MDEGEGRSPYPLRGDPSARTMRLSLTAGEWRKLRAWAAEDDTSVEAVVVAILRAQLERRPRRTFGHEA